MAKEAENTANQTIEESPQERIAHLQNKIPKLQAAIANAIEAQNNLLRPALEENLAKTQLELARLTGENIAIIQEVEPLVSAAAVPIEAPVNPEERAIEVAKAKSLKEWQDGQDARRVAEEAEFEEARLASLTLQERAAEIRSQQIASEERDMAQVMALSQQL